MEKDLRWIAISDSADALEQLCDYIRGKFADNSTQHKLTGSAQFVRTQSGGYMIWGSWSSCLGYDLGYWLKADSKEELIRDVMFFEERHDDDLIYVYVPGMGNNEVFGKVKVVGNLNSPVPEDDTLQSYEDIWGIIRQWLSHGDKEAV